MNILTGMTLKELEVAARSLGLERWRAKAILAWVHRRGAESFEAMTDLSPAMRVRLASAFTFRATSVAFRRASPDGTTKFLIRVAGGDAVETVLIPDGARRTICLSTQVGCPIRCVFCASGMNGLKRNLTAAEIVEQILHVQQETDRPISNLVIMGIGEPLLNYEHLVRALSIMNAPWGLGIGYHRITLSTVGILDRLEELVAAGVKPNLALSLHAPNDAIRQRVVPTLPKVRVEHIIEAGRTYKRRTRKDVTCEYVLLAGINDAPEHAAQLAQLLRGSGLKVNVIPWNRVAELPYREPSAARAVAFAAVLKRGGVPVTVRKRKGDEIAAACGQLRASFAERSLRPA